MCGAEKISFAYDTGKRLTQITFADSFTMMFGCDYRGRRSQSRIRTGKRQRTPIEGD